MLSRTTILVALLVIIYVDVVSANSAINDDESSSLNEINSPNASSSSLAVINANAAAARRTRQLYKPGLTTRNPVQGRKDSGDDMMLAMLVAYKLKFIALIPTIIGGLKLLISTTALAGFFFSLFAAVLSLKSY